MPHRTPSESGVQETNSHHGLIAWWGGLVTRQYRRCVFIAIVVTLILAAGLPWIGFDIDPNATITADNAATRDLDSMRVIFGPDDNDLVVMITGDELLDRPTLDAMRKLRDEIRAIPEVESIASIFDLKKRGRMAPLIPRFLTDSFDASELQQDLQNHPIASRQMIGSDDSLVVMVARLKGGSLTVAKITEALDPINAAANAFESQTSASVRLAGHPAVRADVLVTLQRAMLVGCTGAVIIAFFVSMLMFRRLVPVLVVVAAPTIGTVWTFGAIAWSGVAVGGLLTALPNLVFIVGLTDAVHLVLDYQRQLRSGLDRKHAVYESICHVGPACFLTSLTTFIGFGSLMLSNTESVQQFGLWSALGTTLALFAVVFALPLLLQAVPQRMMEDRNARPDQLGGWVRQLIEPMLQRPGLTSAFAIALSLVLLVPALNQRPDIVWTEAIPQRSASVIAMNDADEKIGGALLVYVTVTWPDDKDLLDREVVQVGTRTQGLLREAEKFSGEFSIFNVMTAAPGRSLREKARVLKSTAAPQIRQLVNTEQRTMRVSARVPNDGAYALNQRVQLLEQNLAEVQRQHPGFKLTLTGTVVAASKNMNSIILDLAKSLAIAALLIFVVIVIAFRSWKIGLLTIVPNTLPLLITSAGLSLTGQPLQITSAVTFSLCLGLAVDDTIHVLIRYKSCHRRQPDPGAAMREAIQHVGPALVATTLILLGGFAALMLSPLPSIRLFSTLSAITLIAALIGDLLFLPAMLVYADRSHSPAGTSSD